MRPLSNCLSHDLSIDDAIRTDNIRYGRTAVSRSFRVQPYDLQVVHSFRFRSQPVPPATGRQGVQLQVRTFIHSDPTPTMAGARYTAS